MQEIKVNEVFDKTGVTRRALQGYEKKGLVSPSGKNKYGHLLYGEKEVERIREIKLYQEFGFSLNEIKVLLSADSVLFKEMISEKLIVMKEDLSRLKENIRTAEDLLRKR